MTILTGTPKRREAFIQALETLAWNIFPTIGRTVVEIDGKKYLVNRHKGVDHHTLTPLRYAETTYDVEQKLYWLPDPRGAGYEQEYLDLIQIQMDASGLTQDDNFQPTQTDEY